MFLRIAFKLRKRYKSNYSKRARMVAPFDKTAEQRFKLALYLLLESESSSDDDEELLALISAKTEAESRRKVSFSMRKVPKLKSKTLVAKPLARTKNFVTAAKKFPEIKFKRHFRMSRDITSKLIESFTNSEFCPVYLRRSRSNITAETNILCFLWFAGNNCTLRQVAQQFRLSPTACHQIIQRVMKFLVSIAPTVITFPITDAEKSAISTQFFQIASIPNIIGCIDETTITLKNNSSVILQAICDNNKKFINVFTIKNDDPEVYQKSLISKEIKNLCDDKYHLLGSEMKYSIREWLITPYKHDLDEDNLTPEEVYFNQKFFATKVQIENAFGILKGKFRQLHKLEFYKTDAIFKFILSCCVLHNLAINDVDIIDNNCINSESDPLEIGAVNDTDEELDSENQASEMQLKRLGESKRNQIKDLLFNECMNI